VIDGVDGLITEYCMPPHPRADALGPYPTLHLTNSEYVGDATAREAAETFYRMAPAYVETLDVGVLEEYFTRDIFGAGLFPKDAVASITIFLDECQSSCVDLYGYQYLRCQSSPLHLGEEGLDAMFDGVRSILPNITLFTRSKMPWEAMTDLENFLPLYHYLLKCDTEISVVYCYGSRYNGWPWPGKPYTGPRVSAIDLGAIMELEVSEWPRHFIKQCQKQAPASYTWVKDNIEAGLAFKAKNANAYYV